jgi:homoserine kinase
LKVSVKVPATTANLGPGFDCFGLALPFYNTVTIEELVYPTEGIEVNVFSDNLDISDFHIPTDETNIVYKAIELLYNYVGQVPQALRINIQTEIPIAKGLGSSASVIIGGIMAANELLGNPADEAAILSIATEVEGHPDNVSPAMMGGFVLSSAEDDGSIVYRKIKWPDEWNLTICIPDYELSTSISRSVLPQKIDMKDAAFNARRCAMFIEAIHTNDAELMKLALQDKLHQPFRTKLVPGLDEIIQNLKHVDSVLGTVLSGAGPSMLVISTGNNLDEIKNIIKTTWDSFSVKADIKTVNIENNGARLI